MNSERLLLVEDDETTREVLTLLLEAEGWQVLSAESGEAATALLHEAHGDVAAVLCDLHLPGLQGVELASSLRQVAPHARLLAMSAANAEGEVRAAYDAILRKPFDGSAVRNAIEEVLSRSATDQDATAESSAEQSAVRQGLDVIAPQILLKLEQQMGARAKDLYAFALADAGDRLLRMKTSIENKDWTAFRSEAHALKGSAGMIGAERLADLAGKAESFPAGSSEGSLDETVRHMYLACGEIRLMLETLFPM